ncbi:alpha/beta fold hydrolase [Ferruginibacter paludis]|uniref:alpha/beta fold hydrolase n=1 Tax=Ferruginibacter paludis TaxID=1310417 RepID=UPI0025B356E5|nr:alpha/beta fold hydrolase [Ferruginibacter paludis]MDN3656816.1 alpha/beta fold hydrolase [Ferruginibacter paludis]
MLKKLGTLIFMALFFTACKKHTGNNHLRYYKDNSGNEQPVSNALDWNKKRLQVLDSLQAAMGALPSFDSLPAFDLQIRDSLPQPGYIRYTIDFLVAANERLPAYLYIPVRKDNQAKLPAMLALHETDSLGKGSVDGQGHNLKLAYAKELAQRGYVVIAPDYPSFGDLKKYDFKNSRYQSGTMKSIFDAMRCVDLLLTRKDVDPERIGIIGHSLGGHSALFAAAFDTRLKVVVSSCGWTLFDNYNIGKEAEQIYGGRLGPWAQDRYMPLLKNKYHLDPAKMPFDFDEVIAAIAPRSVFTNAPLKDGNFDVQGVQQGIANVRPVYHLLQADDHLQASYPSSEHDFPTDTRLLAYHFIDQAFHHIPTTDIPK